MEKNVTLEEYIYKFNAICVILQVLFFLIDSLTLNGKIVWTYSDQKILLNKTSPLAVVISYYHENILLERKEEKKGRREEGRNIDQWKLSEIPEIESQLCNSFSIKNLKQFNRQINIFSVDPNEINKYFCGKIGIDFHLIPYMYIFIMYFTRIWQVC